MIESTYEPHVMENELLPFIFHTDDVVNQVYFPNWHENIEILSCISGRGIIRCDANDYEMVPGDIIVINSNLLHASHSLDNLIYHCLIIDENFCLSNGIPTSKLRFQEFIHDPKLTQVFDHIVSAFAAKKQEESCLYQTALIRNSVLELLIFLCQNYVLNGQENVISSSPSAERAKEVMLYIRNHISEPITLEDISHHVGISKYYLSREFKAFTGRTIFDTINLFRCADAKHLISNGSTVSEAAIACGFENLSYFSRTFKKYIGKLPSQYSKSGR